MSSKVDQLNIQLVDLSCTPGHRQRRGVHGRPEKKTPVETCFLLFCSYHNPVVSSSWWNKFASLMGGGSDSLRQEPERTTNQTWQQSRDQASSRLFKAEWGEPVNTDCAIANIVVV